MNYNELYFKSHVYLQNNGKRGLKDYNDTKWVQYNDRYRKLVELESELINEQPFGIVSNKRGFDKLIDLMEKSNYSFEDIHSSLVDTYKMSLANAMSRMLVNTHAVMFKCSSTDRRYVATDQFSKYYIVEVRFDQLHFGDRDEFIRQQISKMNTSSNGKFIPLNEFIKSPYIDILGFNLMCCVNGYICNDCLVGINDHGFIFKIYWAYDHKKCDFTIYKLDTAFVHTFTTTFDQIESGDVIPISMVGKYEGDMKCILNIYDKNFARTVSTVPNFGMLTSTGLKIMNLQDKTLDDFRIQRTKDVEVVIYALKYFHEIPNIYPAMNYYDIVDTRRVYVDNMDNGVDRVTDVNGNGILSSSLTETNELEICTPPIVLDHPAYMSFSTIVDCIKLREKMIEAQPFFQKVNDVITGPGIITNVEFLDIKNYMTSAKNILDDCFVTYTKGALLTSLVSPVLYDKFETLMDNVNNIITCPTQIQLPKYLDSSVFPELYNMAYTGFVNEVTAPFTENRMANFVDVIKSSTNYFVFDNTMRFNRPVSEQCLIAMKYNRVEKCWVFDVPEIKHFKGVGNTFYIDTGLTGDEIFKFFVLYTDTENPAETDIEPFELDQVFDFDKFCNEVNRHMGYIRYWHAENKLMKLCKTVYNEYSGEKIIQVLSKILKRKLDGEDIIDEYPTMMNYEESNASSLNWKDYDETTDEGPFDINFLFYTLNMMNGNEDQLQSFFYRRLTDVKYNNRFADIDVSSVIDTSRMFPVNYSKISLSPVGVDINASSLPTETGVYGYYGLPYTANNNGVQQITSPHRYTFNVYEDDIHYPLITKNDIDDDYYVGFTSVSTSGYIVLDYHNDIMLGNMVSKYITYSYDLISFLQTNYRHAYNTIEEINNGRESINNIRTQILDFYHEHETEFIHPGVSTVIDEIENDGLNTNLDLIIDTINDIESVTFNGRTKSILDVVNDLLKMLKSVYMNTGFDSSVERRVRNLYINLKQINHMQSLYQFKKWVENIDIQMIDDLENTRSMNIYNVFAPGSFSRYGDVLRQYQENTPTKLDTLYDIIETLTGVNNSHFTSLIAFVKNIANTYIFDFYTLDDVLYDDAATYGTEPYLVTIDLTHSSQLHPPVGQVIDIDVTLVLQPITDKVADNTWKITALSKICEYAFFGGNDISATMKVCAKNGSVITTKPITLKFNHIGSSADSMQNFNQLPNVSSTPIDIQNIHEEFEINNANHIVNRKFGKMNYELLIGNSFTQLEHTSELILDPVSFLPGPVDRIYLPGYMINKFTNRQYGHHIASEMYFKPVQVMHIPLDNDTVTSIGGKYFVGQTLYATEGKTVFPIIVTAVDYSESNGFVEARVDSEHAKWLKLTDPADITNYLENTITCTILDDNISNFLDEYSHSGYEIYQIPEFDINNFDPTDEDNPNMYTMPGDPVFVTSNAPYVYTRLQYMFNELVPNRFMDDKPQTHHLIFMGDSFVRDENDVIRLKVLNHSFESLTDPEKYPVLRTEPDDHFIWAKERVVFQKGMDTKRNQANDTMKEIIQVQRDWSRIPVDQRTKAMEEAFKMRIDSLHNKYDRQIADYNRYKSYLTQQEYPTTWYNIRTYESARVYIDNGRAPLDLGYKVNTRNIPVTADLHVYLYDWEHHEWIDPSLYSVDIELIDQILIGEYDNYLTNQVLNSITITPGDGFVYSREILVYLGYDNSDVFDDIEINDKECEIKFKPLLSVDNTEYSYDPYTNINIRKHFDGHEKYKFDEIVDIPDSTLQGYVFERPENNGQRIHSPSIRFCDMTATDDNDNTYHFTDFDLYLPLPFKRITSTQPYIVPLYATTIVQPIENFVPNQTIKLMCISNNDDCSYDGNISTVVFEAFTELDDHDNQTLTITGSTLPGYIAGRYVCTVIQDNAYSHTGGVVVVIITSDEMNVIDGNWIKIPDSFSVYKTLPKRFALVPHEPIADPIIFDFETKYLKETDEQMTLTNENIGNPYEYYFNSVKDIRYPISEVRRNQHLERMVIDQTLNPDVKLIKSTYISICRYSLQKIPKDGIIDMTGYLPTPLSRERYEFWVNGRCIRNDYNVKILSPTSIQLLNLQSLRNFECIELIDDVNDSELMAKGPVYIDLNGNMYSSYKTASIKPVYGEYVQYTFNTNNQQKMQTNTTAIISNPNNKNIETDILDTVTFNDPNPTHYEELFNIPSINGVDIFHPMSYNLGIVETPNEKIIDMLDKTWNREACTNPVFPMTHHTGMDLIDGERINLRVRYSSMLNKYVISTTGVCNGFFTLYISRTSQGIIDDTSNTVKIIPFIRTGVVVYVDPDCRGNWLCCTHPNVKPVKIM